MISYVNMSTLGTPRCLNNADRYSFATRGVYIISSLFLYMVTMLIARSLLSFSWSSFPTPLCLTLPRVYTSVKTSSFMIVSMVLCVIPILTKAGLDGGTIPTSGTPGLQYTTMQAIFNPNMMTMMNEYGKVVKHAHTIMKKNGEAFLDLAVLAESFTMASISTKCNHTSSRYTSSVSYERVPTDMTKIVTQLDLMHMPMTTNTTTNTKARVNPVSSSISCIIATMVEFSERIENMQKSRHTIVVTDVMSVIHAAMIVFAFRSFYLSKNWHEGIGLVVLAREDTVIGMNRYIGSKDNVIVTTSTDDTTEVFKILNTNEDVNVTVHTHSHQIVNMCLYPSSDINIIVNFVMSVKTIENERTLSLLCARMNGVVEAVPCSDPDLNVVRVSPALVNGDVSRRSIRLMNGNTSRIALMRWYNNMIRHMDLNGACIDCQIMFRIARPLALAMSDGDENENTVRITDAITDFSARVSTKGMVDLDIA